MKKILISTLLLVCFSAVMRADAAERQYDWFWFLYEKDAVSVYPSTMITPFYLKSRAGSVEYTASLPPFIFTKYSSTYACTRTWLLGLAGDTEFTHPGGIRDYDLGIMPFILYGSSPDKKDRYFFMWPIGGTIKGKLAMEYISPWVFPGIALAFLYPPSSIPMLLLMLPVYAAAAVVPVYVSYGRGDYSAQAIFWPLIQWGSSPERNDFRILPFYSHNTKKNYYDNRSWMMLGIYTKTFLSHGREEDTFMLFPFFARRWSNDGISGGGALLWPFFSWGYNKKAGDFEMNFPWPLFSYQRSEKPYVRKLVLFPFYGDIRYEKDRTFFITPLYFSLNRENDTFTSSYHISALICWYFTRDYKKSPSPYYGQHWSYFKIWPFFRLESNDRGDFHFNALSLLFFRDPAGYEKIYDPWWSLVEYHRDNGVKRFGLLMRTYYQCWNDSFFSMKIPFIISYYQYNGSVARCTVLCSMFGYEKDAAGSYMRLFWFPVRIGRGDPACVFNEQEEKPDYALLAHHVPADISSCRYAQVSGAFF